MQLDYFRKFGDCSFDFSLKDVSFFKVGGHCNLFFSPYDTKSLSLFLKNSEDSINCLGNLSNVLISDSGLNQTIINLKSNFNNITFGKDFVQVQAGVSLTRFITECIARSISCVEKLYSIPGTIGGAVYMNAGIPSFEISEAIVSLECINKSTGEIVNLRRDNLDMQYRKSNIPSELIVTSVRLKTFEQAPEKLKSIIKELKEKRLKTQPIGEKTCGSTFKNPQGFKAWQLIKEAGCEKLSIGDAVVSDLHCNFLINSGNATAFDFFRLIQAIKEKVFKRTGILLEEEIIILGEF